MNVDMDTYRELVKIGEQRAAIEAKARTAVIAAVEAGRDRGEIADALGISRATVYRWYADSDPDPGRGVDDPTGAMRDALLTLLELGAGPEYELHRGLAVRGHRASERQAIARRVKLGLRNLPPAVGMTDEQRSILSAGAMAAEQVLPDGRT